MEISIVILSCVILGLNPEMPVFIRLIMICNLNGFRQIKYIHTYNAATHFVTGTRGTGTHRYFMFWHNESMILSYGLEVFMVRSLVLYVINIQSITNYNNHSQPHS